MDIEEVHSHFGYVYRITNLINGKTYIGQRRSHKDKSWSDYFGSGKLISQAIKKYGRNNFSKELVCFSENSEDLTKAEAEMIVSEWKNNHGEYNMSVFIPSPDSWTRLPKDQKEEMGRRISSSLIKLNDTRPLSENPSHMRAIERQNQIIAKFGLETLINKYLEVGSIDRTANFFNISIKSLRAILHKEGVIKPSRKQPGWSHSQKTIEKISNSVKEYSSNNGRTKKQEYQESRLKIKQQKLAQLKSLGLDMEVTHVGMYVPTKEEYKKILSLYSSGLSLRNLSRTMHKSKDSIRRILEASGVIR